MDKKTPLWKFPWGYNEGFLIAIGLMITGFILELATGSKGISAPTWPYNVISLVVLDNVLIVVYIYLGKTHVVQWLSGVPAAISSIVLFGFLGLLLGFVPQDDVNITGWMRAIGLSHMSSNWAFLFSQLFFLTTLGLVTIKRTQKLTRKNIGFLLNHAGLWITIASAVIGSGDLKRLSMQIEEGAGYSNIAFDHKGGSFQLPLALKLNNFDIEIYAPKIALVDGRTDKIVYTDKQNFLLAEPGAKGQINDWDITVLTYIEQASRRDSIYEAVTTFGATPAAYISVVNSTTGKSAEGWVSSGNFMVMGKFLQIDDTYYIGMLAPEAKKYSSHIDYVTSKEEQGNFLLEVNKPVTLNGWKIYQTGYDERYGRWSTTSVIELVNDPWLPIVYFGIMLMLGGAAYIFWIGKDNKA